MATDAELLSAWRRGDDQAFATLYARHRRGVYLCILSAVGDADTAEDLLQETFLKVFRRGLGSRNGHTSMAPYLATVGRNLAADWRRREARGTRACARVARFLEARESAGAEGLSAQEAGELLWRVPEEQREAVILRVYGGLSFAEIGELTDVPLNTAASRYRYGIEKIRTLLAGGAE
ncbi:MAG TPA: sigma-70 family RNA polymerase sigma factor [Planctomycetota bacterium]|jgi:RNA polymerase sigma-70 factor (ECF subfamily)|nr:sigma-70 family RNA polymerase sigma factor [Planctomycetota bacterium]OQC21525.1 MAG: RNA polymerase sigma factor SigY [Planctomycetes bacterium ADurb.Bin069]HNS00232.1 sigma-70 family RNA polymerase sigma factor [Planctomycetota bacterium]HNU26153.1 sigma-70 family RNA polymerase sigma factor [Planctomycetota bacterium]HOE28832.1 sigma-70 family RNA polymerase sigma factor [Planctomycetota bacterium]